MCKQEKMTESTNESSNYAKGAPSARPEADTDASAAAEAKNDNNNDDNEASPSNDIQMKEPEEGLAEEEGEDSAEEKNKADNAMDTASTSTTASPIATAAAAAAAAAEADTAKENSDMTNTAATDGSKKADEAMGEKRKDIEFELPAVPTKAKKARTAYFLFADEKRPEVVLAVSSFLIFLHMAYFQESSIMIDNSCSVASKHEPNILAAKFMSYALNNDYFLLHLRLTNSSFP